MAIQTGREGECFAERRPAAALRQGRSHVGCIVLGRDAPAADVERWLRAAASVPAFIGFAVGRSTFAGPLRDWRQGIATGEQAVQRIADCYGPWTRTFVEAQSLGSAPAEPPGARP